MTCSFLNFYNCSCKKPSLLTWWWYKWAQCKQQLLLNTSKYRFSERALIIIIIALATYTLCPIYHQLTFYFQIMRKLFGIKVKNIIVIWIFVDLLINIGLFICGFFISKSLALSFNPYLWLVVSIIGNVVLSSVVSFDKWRGFVDSWQIVAIIITCMHTICAVYLVIAVIS